jgi:hypothetical protein
MTPILLVPGSAQNASTQPSVGGGETPSVDCNEVKKDAFEILLAEQLLIALVPQIQTAAVAPSSALPSSSKERLQLVQVEPPSNTGIPLHAEPLRNESTMLAFSQNRADHDTVYRTASIQSSLVGGNSAPAPMGDLIRPAQYNGQGQAESTPIPVDQNLLRSMMSKPSDVPQTALLPLADANSVPAPMGEQVQFDQHIVRGEMESPHSPATQATVKPFAVAVGEQQVSAQQVTTPSVSPPTAEVWTTPRTVSQLPGAFGVGVIESGEMPVVTTESEKNAAEESLRLNSRERVGVFHSNDTQRAGQKERFTPLQLEQPKSEGEGMRMEGKTSERAAPAVEDGKRRAGEVKPPEHSSVPFASHAQGVLHAGPTATGSPAVTEGAREASPLLQEDTRILLEQVKQALALQVREQTTEVRIRLQPESLGTMVVSIQQEEAKVAAEIRVEHSSVKAAIDTQLPNLRQALQSQGLDLQQLEVVVADQSMARDFLHQPHASQKRRARNSNLLAADARDAFTPRSLGYNTLELLF